jgi:hypothetical protein
MFEGLHAFPMYGRWNHENKESCSKSLILKEHPWSIATLARLLKALHKNLQGAAFSTYFTQTHVGSSEQWPYPATFQKPLWAIEIPALKAQVPAVQAFTNKMQEALKDDKKALDAAQQRQKKAWVNQGTPHRWHLSWTSRKPCMHNIFHVSLLKPYLIEVNMQPSHYQL